MADILLIIDNCLDTIQFAWNILDFTMFTQYILYDGKKLRYIEHALFRLEKTKIA